MPKVLITQHSKEVVIAIRHLQTKEEYLLPTERDIETAKVYAQIAQAKALEHIANVLEKMYLEE